MIDAKESEGQSFSIIESTPSFTAEPKVTREVSAMNDLSVGFELAAKPSTSATTVTVTVIYLSLQL